MQKVILFFLLFLSYTLLAQHGLQGEYFDGKNFDRKIATRTDASLDFYWPEHTAPFEGLSPADYSIKWTGFIIAPESGVFTFSAIVDDGLKVTVGGVLVIDSWQLNDYADYSGRVKLEAGAKYPILVEYFNGLLEGEIHLFGEKPSFEQSFWEKLTSDKKGEKIPNTSFLLPKKTIVKKKPQPKKTAPKPAKPTKPTKQKKPKQKPKQKPIEESSKPIIESTLTVKKEKVESLDTLQVFLPENIYFKQSKPTILPNSFSALDGLALMLLRHPNLNLKIEGHTDNIGDAKLNMNLSKQRALKVAQYLMKKGITAERLSALGYGGRKPIATNDTNKGRAQNRRVEFELY